MSKDDPKTTTTEHVTPEDLTDDLLDVANGPRGPTSQRLAQELSKVNMRDTLYHLGVLREMFDEDMRIHDQFTLLSQHAEKLFHNSRWWDEVSGKWIEVKWDKDENHILFALLEKYEEVFSRCNELEEIFDELLKLHHIVQKVKL